jgi:hypothetical protein
VATSHNASLHICRFIARRHFTLMLCTDRTTLFNECRNVNNVNIDLLVSCLQYDILYQISIVFTTPQPQQNFNAIVASLVSIHFIMKADNKALRRYQQISSTTIIFTDPCYSSQDFRWACQVNLERMEFTQN